MSLETQYRSLWQEVRYRLYYPKNFRKLIYLKRNFDLNFLYPKDIDIAIPKSLSGLAPDCANCLNLCCTGPNAEVSLRLLDIAKLLDLDQNLEHFITHERLKKSYFFNLQNKKELSYRRQVALESIYAEAFPVLARDKYGTCKLLNDKNNCRVYPSWPLSCARYPYAINAQRRVIFFAKSCQSTQTLPFGQANPNIKKLVNAALESYNERIREIILIYTAQEELKDLGLLKFIKLEKFKYL